MAHFLDADVFIRAKNLHYGFDFCPAFWDWLIRQNQAGDVYSIERVGDELLAGGDELADWARRGGDFFIPPDATLFPALATVSSWATESYGQGAVSTQFLRRLASEIGRRVALDVQRHGIRDMGCRFRLAYFPPCHRLPHPERCLGLRASDAAAGVEDALPASWGDGRGAVPEASGVRDRGSHSTCSATESRIWVAGSASPISALPVA